MSKFSQRRFIWVTVACLVLGSPGALLGQDDIDPRLKQVVVDWQKRRAYPPVRYDVQGRVFASKESALAYLKTMNRKASSEVKDVHLKWNLRLLLDIQRQRHRYEYERESRHVSTGQIRSEGWINAFDGATLTGRSAGETIDGKKLKKKASTPDVSILTGNLAKVDFPLEILPLFAGHGVVRFPPKWEIIPGKLNSDPDVSLMTAHGSDVFEGRPCLVLRSYPDGRNFTEYWVDTQRDGALLRWLTYAGGFPIMEINVRYRQHGPYFLVESWTFEARNWFPEEKKSVTEQIDRFHVAKVTLEPNVPDSEFRLQVDPGALITKTHNDPDNPGKTQHYRVDPSGRENPVYFQKGVEYAEGGSIYWWGLVGLVAAVTLGYVGFRFWKRRHAPATPPTGI